MKLKRKSMIISSFMVLDCLFAGIVLSGKVMGNTTTSVAKKDFFDGTTVVQNLTVINDNATEEMEYSTISQEDLLISHEIILNYQNNSVKTNNTSLPIVEASTNGGKVSSNVIVSNSNAQVAKKKKEADEAALAASIAKNPGSATGIAIAQYSMKFNGKAYVFGGYWNGEMPYTPTDCSGFMQGLYKHFGINIPRTARAQAQVGREVSIKDIQPGDLVFYSNGGPYITHVAMYIGNGKIIHARTPGLGIGVNSVFIMRRITIRRIIN